MVTSFRDVLKDAAKNVGTVMLGSSLGGSIIGFLNGFGIFVHGEVRSLGIEAALAGGVFGLLAGTVYLAPFAAIIGGGISRFVSRRAASISAITLGAVVFSLAVLIAVVVYSGLVPN